MVSKICLITLILVAVFCLETHQGIVVSSLSVHYDMKAEYGNLSIADANETHFGEVKFYFNEKISDFIFLFIMRSSDGKVIYNQTNKPCGIKKNKKLDALLKMMFDPENKKSSDVDHDPFPWRCPIKQGTSIIAPEAKEMKFSLMVPSFLSITGTAYSWMEAFLTKKNGKWETFLTETKPFDIEIV